MADGVSKDDKEREEKLKKFSLPNKIGKIEKVDKLKVTSTVLIHSTNLKLNKESG